MPETVGDAEPKPPTKCDFCKRGTDDVQFLVAGPGVGICDGCVRLCVDIIADHDRASKGLPRLERHDDAAPAWSSRFYCSLCRMPVVVEDTIPVEERGLLCRSCVTSIQAATARRVER